VIYAGQQRWQLKTTPGHGGVLLVPIPGHRLTSTSADVSVFVASRVNEFLRYVNGSFYL